MTVVVPPAICAATGPAPQSTPMPASAASVKLEGFDIKVVTLNGDVRVTGMLDNQAQIDEALRVVRASDGAHSIHDELTIRKKQAIMLKSSIRPCIAVALSILGFAITPIWAQTGPDSTGPVTVVVEVALAANATAAEALEAVNDMRAMMKRQPGYLSEEFLQNLNASNVPRYVHVSRWASMTYWTALFRTPEFSRLNAHGNEHYTISASAFLPAE